MEIESDFRYCGSRNSPRFQCGTAYPPGSEGLAGCPFPECPRQTDPMSVFYKKILTGCGTNVFHNRE